MEELSSSPVLKRLPGSKYFTDFYSALLLAVAEWKTWPRCEVPAPGLAAGFPPIWVDAYQHLSRFVGDPTNNERSRLEGWADWLMENKCLPREKLTRVTSAIYDAILAIEKEELQQTETQFVATALADLDATWQAQGSTQDRSDFTMADARRLVGKTRWVWPDWLMAAHLNVLAADPGIGKSFLALELTRRYWLGLANPDGSESGIPAETPSLWIPSDRNHAELAERMEGFGIPDEAIILNGRGNPFDSLILDDADVVDRLGILIQRHRPAIVVIDTINRATRRALFRPEEAAAFFDPLVDLAQRTGTPFLALTHLSKGGEPLDRRIEGVCRVMLKLSQPDPIGQPDRRRLWVEKTNSRIPDPLGVTFGGGGCDFDDAPPEKSEGGRLSDATQKAKDFLIESLRSGPSIPSKLIEAAEDRGISRATLYRAKGDLGIIGNGRLWSIPPAP